MSMADEPNPPTGVSRLRRWGIGLNVLVSCAALLAIVGMLNYLASRHFIRFNWTGDTQTALSPLTRRVLASLTNEVKVIVLFEPDAPGTLYADVRTLARAYRDASPRVQVEFVDYLRNSRRAAQVKAQYLLSPAADADLVIFDCGGRHRIVNARELSDYDVGAALRRQPVRRTAFKGEQFFTSAILSVAEAKPLKAYTLVGHREHDFTSEDSQWGYQKFADLLREKNIVVEPLSLQTNDVPDDCALLIVAGPRTRIPTEELDRIDAYLKKGGRLFSLLPNTLFAQVPRSGLERRLADWNIEVGDNLVEDRAQSQTGSDRTLFVSEFRGHPMVNPLHGARLALVTPRSVRQRTPDLRGADAVKVDELAFTSPSGRALVSLGAGRGVVETNGAIPLIVAAQKGTVSGVRPDRDATRLVVVGESMFLANALIEAEANRDFASLAVNWLLGRMHLLDIDPRPLREYQVSLTVAQRRNLRWLLLGAMPGSVLFLGFLVWVRRRK